MPHRCHSPPRRTLRELLLRGGVAPRHVRRYLRELNEHLADLTAEEIAAGHAAGEAKKAALARLGGIDELAEAMIRQRQFRSWTASAPWAVFSIGPVAALAGAYFVACACLWWGWQLFVPLAETPFGYAGHPIYALANVYFLADKSWYFGAPIIVGLGIALVAIRQRLRIFWPTVGLALDTLVGATAHIQASRLAVPKGLGHISMSFLSLPASSAAASGEIRYAAAIVALSMLPYFAWRLRRVDSLSR